MEVLGVSSGDCAAIGGPPLRTLQKRRWKNITIAVSRTNGTNFMNVDVAFFAMTAPFAYVGYAGGRVPERFRSVRARSHGC